MTDQKQHDWDVTKGLLRPLLGALLQDGQGDRNLVQDEREHELVSKLYSDIFHGGKGENPYGSAQDIWTDVIRVVRAILERRRQG